MPTKRKKSVTAKKRAPRKKMETQLRTHMAEYGVNACMHCPGNEVVREQRYISGGGVFRCRSCGKRWEVK